MADRREVVITIKSSSVEQPKQIIQNIVNNNITQVIAQQTTTPNSATYSTGESESHSVLANQVFQYLKQNIVTEARYQINKYFVTHDDYVGQRNMNIALGLVDDAVAFGSSAMSGAMAGSTFGPVGTVVGAVVGAMTTAITKGVSVFNTLDSQNLLVSQNNAQLAFTRQRSGYSLTSGSTGENR